MFSCDCLVTLKEAAVSQSERATDRGVSGADQCQFQAQGTEESAL